jgi:type III restriction enzyme
MAEAIRLINEQKATVIIEHLAYDPVEDKFDLDIFTAGLTKQDFSKAGDKLQRHIYDYVLTDSNIERKFVKELDSSKEVVVYAKLPRGFLIPTPVGDYNPDWAISFKEGTVKHVTSWPKPRARCRRWSCGISRKPRSSAPESSSKNQQEVRT